MAIIVQMLFYSIYMILAYLLVPFLVLQVHSSMCQRPLSCSTEINFRLTQKCIIIDPNDSLSVYSKTTPHARKE